jgi:putative oxidoreductase
MNSPQLQNISTLAGRILLSIMFIMAGINKIGGYEGTQGYMQAMGVPGALLPLVILLEIGAGLALLIGWKARIMAFLLAGFTLIAAFIFHHNFADQTQMIMFLKNLSISGGLLFVFAFGPGAWSLDKE